MTFNFLVLFLTFFNHFSNAYKAAIIEHQVIQAGNIHSTSDALAIMNANLNILEPNIIKAASQGANLVLLSEMAITSLIKSRSEMFLFLYNLPDSNANVIACNNNQYNNMPILQRLSCLAANNSIYLAVNWGDIVPCSHTTDINCPSDNHYQYNTEIIFDNNGKIISKYYKIHTFTATEFDTPKNETYNYFIMNNIKIGIITCFDSMFATPLIPLIKNYNISNFIASHWWNNQYAMFSAVSWWQAISKRMNINLITAATWYDTSDVSVYPWSSGSGIFSNGNILASWYNHLRTQQEYLLISDINPNNGGASSNLPPFNGYKTLTSPPAKMCVNKMEWEYNKIEPGINYYGKIECGNFICEVNFKVNQLNTNSKDYWFLYTDTGYYYVPDGNNIYYYEQFCSFYKCYLTSGCLSSSEQSHDDYGGTIFDYIILSGSYMDGSVSYLLVSDGNGGVYKDINEKWTVEENVGNTTAKGLNLNDVIIGASIIGRNYDLDGKYLG